MPERQPIRAVKQERLMALRVIQRVADAQEPLSKCGGGIISAKEISQPVDFQPQRNRCRTAEEQTEDEKQSQPADVAAKNLFAVHGEFNRAVLAWVGGGLLQTIHPVSKEKLFFVRKEGVGFADDGSERSCHLQGD